MSILYYIREVIRKNIKKLIFASIIIILSELSLSFGALLVYTNYIDKQIQFNIYEYDEVDLQHLCNISNCEEIKLESGENFYPNNDRVLLLSNNTEKRFIDRLVNIDNNTFVDTNLNFYVYNNNVNGYFKVSVKDIKKSLFKYEILFLIMFFIIIVVLLLFSIKEEREISLRELAGNEALLTNKSMILITENIHHELNTPMEVIDNKVYKIQNIIKQHIISEYEKWNDSRKLKNLKPFTFDEYKINESRNLNKKIMGIDEDFEYIKQSSEQIYNVLERMKGFKNIRYSNGNKSIYDIIHGAFKVISISNSNFNYNIDENLKKYSINSDNFKNADLLNVIINHVKNSLEANSTKILINEHELTSGFLKFFIIDNGNGIPENKKKDIFKANFSTKTNDDKNIRGNGLYLNKFLLNSTKGNVLLESSSKYGTTFSIKLPVIIRT